MVCKIMAGRMGLWRDVASRSKISLPRLLEFDWRVDLKTSSAQQLSMSKPTAIINLLVRGVCASVTDVRGNCVDANYDCTCNVQLRVWV